MKEKINSLPPKLVEEIAKLTPVMERQASELKAAEAAYYQKLTELQGTEGVVYSILKTHSLLSDQHQIEDGEQIQMIPGDPTKYKIVVATAQGQPLPEAPQPAQEAASEERAEVEDAPQEADC